MGSSSLMFLLFVLASLPKPTWRPIETTNELEIRRIGSLSLLYRFPAVDSNFGVYLFLAIGFSFLVWCITLLAPPTAQESDPYEVEDHSFASDDKDKSNQGDATLNRTISSVDENIKLPVSVFSENPPTGKAGSENPSQKAEDQPGTKAVDITVTKTSVLAVQSSHTEEPVPHAVKGKTGLSGRVDGTFQPSTTDVNVLVVALGKLAISDEKEAEPTVKKNKNRPRKHVLTAALEPLPPRPRKQPPRLLEEMTKKAHRN